MFLSATGKSLFINKMPLWLKISCIIAVSAVVFMLLRLPGIIEAKKAYSRGLKAESEKKYITALREYKHAAGLNPSSTQISIRLGVAYYYNGQVKEASETFDKIADKKASRKVTAEVNGIIKKINSMYYMSEELERILSGYGREELELTRDKLLGYSKRYPEDVLCQFYLGNIYFDLEKYKEAAKYFNNVVSSQPEFFTAYLNLAAASRELGDYEKTIESCQRALKYNKECTLAYVALSKAEQKRGDGEKALEYALQAYNIDPQDMAAAANLCIEYHSNNKAAERDKLLEWLKSKDYKDLETLKQLFSAKDK